MRLASIVPVLAVVLIAAPAHAAPPTPVLVDTCGQVVPPKAAAYLAGDLDCSGYGGSHTVTLRKKATFDLGGFTLTTGGLNGIQCDEGRCTIRNGTVTGAGSAGLAAIKSTIENLTVVMSGLFGVAFDGKSVVRSSTILGTSIAGVYAPGKGKLTIIDSTIGAQRRFGVVAYKVRLEGSTVTGNMTDAECSADALCADLLTARRPQIEGSTCGRSDNLPGIAAEPGCLGWCVCAGD